MALYVFLSGGNSYVGFLVPIARNPSRDGRKNRTMRLQSGAILAPIKFTH
jgi:hypothetical protein